MQKASVKQKPLAAEIPVEVIAQDIAAIAEGMRKMRSGRLTDRAIVTLIHHAAQGVSRRAIVEVMDTIESLHAIYLKKQS